MLALAYARQSDENNRKRIKEDDEETLSTGSQLSACRELALKNGNTMEKEFAEQFTGMSSERPEYREMIRHIQQNVKLYPDPDHPRRIKRLYVYKYARFGRKADDTVPVIGYFRTLGVEIVPARDSQIGDSPLEKAMLYTLMTVAEMQLNDAVQHASDTRRHLTRNGKLVCAGKAIHGYRYNLDTRTREIDTETAPVVARIFRGVAEGKGYWTIANELWTEGVPTPRGKLTRWSERTIVRIVKDPSYKGEPMKVDRFVRTEGRYRNGHLPDGKREVFFRAFDYKNRIMYTSGEPCPHVLKAGQGSRKPPVKAPQDGLTFPRTTGKSPGAPGRSGGSR